jgi:ABC-type spermidine/putrescine transport system, permease component II
MSARLSSLAGLLYLATIYLFVMAPILFIVVMAFNDATSFPAPLEAFTLRWFAAILDQPVFLDAAWTSVLLAVLAAIVACCASFLSAYALWRWTWRSPDAIATFLTSPLLVPQIVMGLAMLQLAELLGLGTNFAGLVAVHAIYVMPFGLRLIMTGFSHLDLSLEEAGQSLGAGRLQTWREVTLPLLRPNLVAAFCFCFMLSFVNLPLSMFLTNPSTATLPTVMFAYIESRIDPMIAALATVIIGLAAFTTLALEKWLKIRLVG